LTDADKTQKFCRLFVYGSLKRGCANHEQLGSAQFVSEARTTKAFALSLVDGYPALIPGTRSIQGELFQIAVSELPGLDEFEGEGYAREEVELDGGGWAIAYLARAPSAGTPYPLDEWSER